MISSSENGGIDIVPVAGKASESDSRCGSATTEVITSWPPRPPKTVLIRASDVSRKRESIGSSMSSSTI